MMRLVALWLFLASSAFAAAPALDGSVASYGASGSSYNVTLTTTAAGTIVVMVAANSGTVSSISDTAGRTYAKRSGATSGGGNGIEMWYANSASAVTSDVITVTLSGFSGFTTIHAFGVSNTYTGSSPWDANAALPDISVGAAPRDPRSATTSNASNFIIGAFRMASTSNPTAGSGYTMIFGSSGSGWALTEYKVVAATQSGLSVTVGTGSNTSNGGIADALMEAGGGGAAPKNQLMLRGLTSLPANDNELPRLAAVAE